MIQQQNKKGEKGFFSFVAIKKKEFLLITNVFI